MSATAREFFVCDAARRDADTPPGTLILGWLDFEDGDEMLLRFAFYDPGIDAPTLDFAVSPSSPGLNEALRDVIGRITRTKRSRVKRGEEYHFFECDTINPNEEEGL